MTIKGKRKRNIVIKSAFCFLLSLCLFLSSFCVSFAFDVPSSDEPVPFDFVVELQSARDWVADMLEQDPDGNIMVYKDMRSPQYNSNIWIWYIPADISIYVEPSTGYIYANGKYGMAGIYQWWIGSGETGINNMTNQFPGNTAVSIDGVTYYRFNGINQSYNNPDGEFYFSADFLDTGGGVSANLDISSYLPSPYIFSAWLTEDKQYIGVSVNFNVDVWDSLITVWGYDEFGPTPYTFSRSDYRQVYFDLEDTIVSTFYLDISAIFSHYLGQDFTISSLSCLGWDDAHEEFLTVNWELSSVQYPTDYNPPDNTYYYSTFINENYSYNNQNGTYVSFGYSRLYYDADYFWDVEYTLIQPYKYSILFFPASYDPVIRGYTEDLLEIFPTLVLNVDVIVLDVPETCFDALYGAGAFRSWWDLNQYFGSTSSFSRQLGEWYASHPLQLEAQPFGEVIGQPISYNPFPCGIFYTDSFFFKSLSYLLGDSNDRLLEFETRLLGEDGAWQVLMDGLKSMYDDNHEYFGDALSYMRSLTYFTDLLLRNDYFDKYLNHLSSIDDKLDDIRRALTGASEEDFDNDLTSPWLDFYRYFKSLFTRSLPLLSNFSDTATEILDGGSDYVGLDFYLDDNYSPDFPLFSNELTPTPTFVPIPTW